ncbi:dihydrodipicolinate synthase family protein [Spiractinospora alimapuensis]|uniref:dihydrodipicolinate synthase family protein n=1 Tax=Spiractinospora alimapuensis TaxID=2820884 RepID=UPI001F41BA5C|nr:dihydrodipicolinate synthase family protein [Spiractinospora alimapuensis]QVQ52220.1 dihydrodipicolinate synthase family protein [Spiractinospora alimapuensis]
MRGILPALMTGYDADGEVDTRATQALVDHLLHAGVHGLFVGGTSAEGVAQSVAEREHLLSASIGHVAGAVPVVAHVGTLATRTTVELARHAQRSGAAAVAAVTPFYFELNDAALADHYRALHAAVDVPVYLYHIPSLTGRSLESAWILDLAHEGVIAGMKYSADDLEFLRQVTTHAPEGFVVHNGADDVLMDGLLSGAVGGVGSSYNVMPELYVALFEAVREGRTDDARAAQNAANAVLATLRNYNFLAFLREVLHLQGIDLGVSRRPLPALTEAERADITAWLDTAPAAVVARATPDRAAAVRQTRRLPDQ